MDKKQCLNTLLRYYVRFLFLEKIHIKEILFSFELYQQNYSGNDPVQIIIFYCMCEKATITMVDITKNNIRTKSTLITKLDRN